MKPRIASFSKKSPSSMASSIRPRSIATTRPAPILVCPTSELPIWPSGRPASRPWVTSVAWGQSARMRSTFGVRARSGALSASVGPMPHPSRMQSTTGLGGADMARMLLVDLCSVLETRRLRRKVCACKIGPSDQRTAPAVSEIAEIRLVDTADEHGLALAHMAPDLGAGVGGMPRRGQVAGMGFDTQMGANAGKIEAEVFEPADEGVADAVGVQQMGLRGPMRVALRLRLIGDGGEKCLEAGRCVRVEAEHRRKAFTFRGVGDHLVEPAGQRPAIGVAHEAEADALRVRQGRDEATGIMPGRQQRRRRAVVDVFGQRARAIRPKLRALQDALDRRTGDLGGLDIDAADAPRPMA